MDMEQYHAFRAAHTQGEFDAVLESAHPEHRLGMLVILLKFNQTQEFASQALTGPASCGHEAMLQTWLRAECAYYPENIHLRRALEHFESAAAAAAESPAVAAAAAAAAAAAEESPAAAVAVAAAAAAAAARRSPRLTHK